MFVKLTDKTLSRKTNCDRIGKRVPETDMGSDKTLYDIWRETAELAQAPEKSTSPSADALSDDKTFTIRVVGTEDERGEPLIQHISPKTAKYVSQSALDCLKLPTARYEAERADREEGNWKCGFLRLSPELRNRIYQDTIPTSTRISVVARVARTEINLLQVCRAIRNETVPIFYGNATFNFDLRTRPNFSKAKAWVDGLSQPAVASLRKIYVHSDLNCCCKGSERGKNDRSTSLSVWIDVDSGKWSQYDYIGCRNCRGSGQEGARDIARRIASSVIKQNVQKHDLVELFEIMRPIKAFDFSFEMAKDGEGQATSETRPRAFGASGTSKKGAIVSPKVAERNIKQPRTRHRPVARLSDIANLSLEDDKVAPKVSSAVPDSIFGS